MSDDYRNKILNSILILHYYIKGLEEGAQDAREFSSRRLLSRFDDIEADTTLTMYDWGYWTGYVKSYNSIALNRSN